jgi:hypothetical protein
MTELESHAELKLKRTHYRRTSEEQTTKSLGETVQTNEDDDDDDDETETTILFLYRGSRRCRLHRKHGSSRMFPHWSWRMRGGGSCRCLEHSHDK